MTAPTNAFVANHILGLLPPREASVVIPHLELVELRLGDLIDEPRKPIQALYFPLHAAISMTDILDEHHTVEVTITGAEGCSGASVVQGIDEAVCMAIVQIGGPAARLPVSALRAAMSHLPYLQGALQRYNGLLLRHAVLSVGCNRFHTNRQRLARWLKAHWDRTGLETFPFSMEFLAAQVGLDRDTIEELVGELSREGIIAKGHRSVRIINQKGLTLTCCECFTICKEASEQYAADLQLLASAKHDA